MFEVWRSHAMQRAIIASAGSRAWSGAPPAPANEAGQCGRNFGR